MNRGNNGGSDRERKWAVKKNYDNGIATGEKLQ